MSTQSAPALARGPSRPQPFDLLRLRPVRRLLRSRWYPAILAWPTLIVFVFITYELVAGPAKAHDNLGTALTWVLWWPLLPIALLLAGRLWCSLCPFGTISDLIQKLVGNNRPVPRFLRKYGIWIIDAMFLLITWGDHVWGVVESPLHSGLLLLGITLGAVVCGALFERRVWCRYLCFLGGVAGNYTRAGIVGLSATPETCATCRTSSCYKGDGKVAGCPMFVFPRTMDTTAECNFCANCVKSCPNGSVRITPRLPTEELWSVKKALLPVAFLSAVIMGIVFVQNITMLGIWEQILAWFSGALSIESYPLVFTVTFLIAMAVPVGLLLAAGLFAGRANGERAAANFAVFGYAIIPLDMAGHIAHNLFHLLAEGKSVAFTAMELVGVSTEGRSAALVDPATIQVLQYALLALGLAGSLYTAWRRSAVPAAGGRRASARAGAFAPYAALLVLLAGLNVYLFALPMSMRM